MRYGENYITWDIPDNGEKEILKYLKKKNLFVGILINA